MAMAMSNAMMAMAKRISSNVNAAFTGIVSGLNLVKNKVLHKQV